MRADRDQVSARESLPKLKDKLPVNFWNVPGALARFDILQNDRPALVSGDGPALLV
jgi:hypothetical protein